MPEVNKDKKVILLINAALLPHIENFDSKRVIP